MRRGGMPDWPCSWAGTGFSGVLPSPTNSISRKGPVRTNRGGRPGQESSRGSTISIYTQLRPQTRVRTRPRMGGKDRRMRSRVPMRLQSFGIIQDPALSAQALLFSLPWLLVPVFHDVTRLPRPPGHAASRRGGRRGTSQLSSRTCFKVDLPARVLSHLLQGRPARASSLPPTHSVPPAPPPGTLPSQQADATLPAGQPQASQREDGCLLSDYLLPGPQQESRTLTQLGRSFGGEAIPPSSLTWTGEPKRHL
ncbi:unnamed protein product [Rangifer tarandus platyrhynchus]|uniref:Uncharacterized protein n=1 Tax=Rangifer tarandus platyrhynchus TaxID=3082113 RepID=A0AC59Z8M4_RANTA